MNTKHIVGVMVAFVMGLSCALAATTQLSVKTGDTAYVCECGSKCACEMASLKPAKCGCGHDLAKVTVTKVKGKKAFYEADGKEQSFKLTGKFVCGCGGECCMMVSQKPGKCSCGKDLVKATKAR
jgi:hypothetical protein